MKTFIKRILVLFLVFALHLTLYTLHSEAAVPHLINYQGRLTDSGGNPLTGSYAVTFRIYDTQTAGTLLWEETYTSLVIDKGLFSVLLGSVANLDIPFDKAYFLEIKVGTEVMTPRQQITSSGYAIRAEKAEDSEKLGAKLPTEYALASDITSSPAANKAVRMDSNAKLPVAAIPSTFGNWEMKNTNTVYQASTDGFVVATFYESGGSNAELTGYVDGFNPPTTRRMVTRENDALRATSFCMPVKKNDYWKVVLTIYAGSPTCVIYWVSLGN